MEHDERDPRGEESPPEEEQEGSLLERDELALADGRRLLLYSRRDGE